MAEGRIFKLWDNKKKRTFEIVATKQGKEWVGICPEHEDKKPSLSINAEKGIYHCHSINCNFSGQLYNPEYTTKGKRKVVAIFDYKDEEGELLYQKLKYDNGKCSQRRPDKNNNTWINNVEGVKKVLYRLPELIASKSDTIYFVEGEKDCDTIYKLELTGTTTAEHKSELDKSYNKYLTGNIILCPDNDEAGEWYMSVIGNALYDTAKEIKILRLPGLENKEDITDWIEKGGTKEKLLELTEKAPLYEKQQIEKPVKSKSIKEVRETKTLIPDLIHLVQDGDKVKYLLKKDGKLHIIGEFVKQDDETGKIYIYTPKQNLPIKIPDISILDESMNVNCKDLFDDVIRFIESYLEMPSENNYKLLALWVFHTYLIEKFRTTPILYFYGVKETGKTRAGEILGELAFRGEMLTSPTAACLFRSAEYFKNSLIIDEIQLWGNDGNIDVANLIKSRYKRGLKVSRVNMNKKGEDGIEYFDVFSPLVICTTETVPEIIQSRCLTFYMQKNENPEVEEEINDKLVKSLRNRLTIFRANYIDKDLANVKPIARRRLNEKLSPLQKILMTILPELEEDFKNIVENMQKEKEHEDTFTIEAEIIKEIAKRKEDFLTTEITDAINEGKPEREKASPRFISIRTERLGFKKMRLQNGRRGFKNDYDLIAKLEMQYKTNQ